MHDLSFKHAAVIPGLIDTLRKQRAELKTEALRPIVAAFDRNLDRIEASIHVPTWLISLSSTLAALQARACQDVLGKPEFDDVQDKHRTQEVRQRFAELINEKRIVPEDMSHWQRSVGVLETILVRESFAHAVETLLANVLIGTWTAFEVMAGDLWVALVNRYPLLGVRALDAEPLETDSAEQSEKKTKKIVSIAAQRTLDPKFDIRASMGDILKDDFPMLSFRRIVSAYEAIFPKDKPSKIIRDQGIHSLAAVRNVLVHKAGIADKEFEQQVRGDDRFCVFKDGSPVELSGTVTLELVHSVMKQTAQLVSFADEWCAKH